MTRWIALLLLTACGSQGVNLGGRLESDAGVIDSGRDAGNIDKADASDDDDASTNTKPVADAAVHADSAPEPDAALGADASSSTPPLTGEVSKVSLGGQSSCAILAEGRVACWGRNDFGQLGVSLQPHDDCSACEPKPIEVPALRGATEIAVGATHACALLSGKVSCWGSNVFGELGIGTSDAFAHPAPTEVDLPDVQSLALGRGFSCARTSGAVYCWGLGLRGQLGEDPANLAACAVSADQLAAIGIQGRASAVPCATQPRPVAGLTNSKAIGAGGFHACAVSSDSVLRCWGYNQAGQVGNGAQADWAAVTPVRTGVDAVMLGSQHSCAIAGGYLVCWGENRFGQLALASKSGEDLQVLLPTPTPILPTVTALATGDAHTCAQTGPSDLYCAGANDDGQLGAATSASCTANGLSTPCSSTMIRATFGSPIAALSSGLSHACVLSGGAVHCWGDNSYGQLGMPGMSQSESLQRVIGP